MTATSLENTAIVFGAEKKTLWPTLCCIQSIIEHHKHTALELYILHTDIPFLLQEITRALFQLERLELSFVDVHQKAKALRIHTHPRWNTKCFMKCYLPVLFREIQNVIWLDSSLLVTGDLTQLLNIVPKDACLSAVADPVAQILRQNKVPISHFLGSNTPKDLPDVTLAEYTQYHLGLTNAERYFNTGLLFLRPKLIKASSINQCFTRAKRPYLFPSDDILNQIFHEKVHLLPERWNFLTGQLTENLCLHLPEHWKTHREAERYHKMILHYPEANKPWHDLTLPGASRYQSLSHKLEKRMSHFLPALLRDMCSH